MKYGHHVHWLSARVDIYGIRLAQAVGVGVLDLDIPPTNYCQCISGAFEDVNQKMKYIPALSSIQLCNVLRVASFESNMLSFIYLRFSLKVYVFIGTFHLVLATTTKQD